MPHGQWMCDRFAAGKRELVGTDQILEALKRTADRALGALQQAAHRGRDLVHKAMGRIRRLSAPDAHAELDPVLDENAPALPGTSSRAFWVGWVVVGGASMVGIGAALSTRFGRATV